MMDNRNLILAIVLSLAVLLGWQYFVAGPQIEKTRQHELAQQQAQSPAAQPGGGAAPSPSSGASPAAPAAPGEEPTLTREAALKGSPRVPIESGKVSGSVNLHGGRIDDLHLIE